MRFSGAWRVGSAGVGRARVNGGDSDRREEKTEKQLARLQAERERHADLVSHHDAFVSKHGIENSQPGSVAGLPTFESDEDSISPSNKKSKKSKKSKKGTQDTDIEFANPLNSFDTE